MKRQLNRVIYAAVPLALVAVVMATVNAQQKPAEPAPSASVPH